MSPSAVAAASGSADNAPYATPVAATLGPFGPVLPDADEGADVVASIVAPDLPAGEVHRMIAVGQGGELSFNVPAAWRDGSIGGPWIYGDDERTGIAAFFAPSEDAFYRDSTEANGVFIGAGPDITTPVDALTQESFELYWRDCTIGGRGRWDDGSYAGNYEIYGPCGDDPIRIIAMLVRDEAGRTMAIDLHLTSQADLAIAAHIIDSVQYEPPGQEGHGPIP